MPRRLKTIPLQVWRFKKPALCLTLAAVYFSTNVVGPAAAETNFWRERQAARRSTDRILASDQGAGSGLTPEHSRLIAQLPAAGLLSRSVTITQGLNHTLSSSLPSAQGSLRESGGPAWLSALLLPYGSIRDIHVSARADAPLVIHIQDAHEIEEAQRNMAAMVQALQEARGISLVGMEGAGGAFSLEPHRNFPDADIARGVADYFLREGYIGGPEFAGITAPQPLTLWGVEDVALYEDNIRAYRESVQRKAGLEDFLQKARASTGALKQRIYPPALQGFDRRSEAYYSRRGGLGDYVRYLLSEESHHLQPGKDLFPNLRLLVRALDQEAALDFKQVERERQALVEDLARTLPGPALDELVQRSMLYRLGRVGYGEYHDYLRRLCVGHGIRLEKFGPLNAYIRYVLLADRIDRHALLAELSRLEERVKDSLAATPELKNLVELDRDLGLLEKLAGHAMTPADWSSYSRDRMRVLEAGPRLNRLILDSKAGVSPVAVPEEFDQVVAPFEAFCARALERNDALVKNLLSKMKAEGRAAAMLVAGGFHSDGLTALMRKMDVSYAVVTPKITEVPRENHSLDVLARDPLPIEKLFAGDVIGLISQRLPAESAERSADPSIVGREGAFHTLAGALCAGAEAMAEGPLDDPERAAYARRISGRPGVRKFEIVRQDSVPGSALLTIERDDRRRFRIALAWDSFSSSVLEALGLDGESVSGRGGSGELSLRGRRFLFRIYSGDGSLLDAWDLAEARGWLAANARRLPLPRMVSVLRFAVVLHALFPVMTAQACRQVFLWVKLPFRSVFTGNAIHAVDPGAPATISRLKGPVEQWLATWHRTGEPPAGLRLLAWAAKLDLGRLRQDWDETHPQGPAEEKIKQHELRRWDILYIRDYAPQIESRLSSYLHHLAVFVGTALMAVPFLMHLSPLVTTLLLILINPVTIYGGIQLAFALMHRYVYRSRGDGTWRGPEKAALKDYYRLFDVALFIHRPMLMAGSAFYLAAGLPLWLGWGPFMTMAWYGGAVILLAGLWTFPSLRTVSRGLWTERAVRLHREHNIRAAGTRDELALAVAEPEGDEPAAGAPLETVPGIRWEGAGIIDLHLLLPVVYADRSSGRRRVGLRERFPLNHLMDFMIVLGRRLRDFRIGSPLELQRFLESYPGEGPWRMVPRDITPHVTWLLQNRSQDQDGWLERFIGDADSSIWRNLYRRSGKPARVTAGLHPLPSHAAGEAPWVRVVHIEHPEGMTLTELMKTHFGPPGDMLDVWADAARVVLKTGRGDGRSYRIVMDAVRGPHGELREVMIVEFAEYEEDFTGTLFEHHRVYPREDRKTLLLNFLKLHGRLSHHPGYASREWDLLMRMHDPKLAKIAIKDIDQGAGAATDGSSWTSLSQVVDWILSLPLPEDTTSPQEQRIREEISRFAEHLSSSLASGDRLTSAALALLACQPAFWRRELGYSEWEASAAAEEFEGALSQFWQIIRNAGGVPSRKDLPESLAIAALLLKGDEEEAQAWAEHRHRSSTVPEFPEEDSFLSSAIDDMGARLEQEGQKKENGLPQALTYEDVWSLSVLGLGPWSTWSDIERAYSRAGGGKRTHAQEAAYRRLEARREFFDKAEEYKSLIRLWREEQRHDPFRWFSPAEIGEELDRSLIEPGNAAAPPIPGPEEVVDSLIESAVPQAREVRSSENRDADFKALRAAMREAFTKRIPLLTTDALAEGFLNSINEDFWESRLPPYIHRASAAKEYDRVKAYVASWGGGYGYLPLTARATVRLIHAALGPSHLDGDVQAALRDELSDIVRPVMRDILGKMIPLLTDEAAHELMAGNMEAFWHERDSSLSHRMAAKEFAYLLEMIEKLAGELSLPPFGPLDRVRLVHAGLAGPGTRSNVRDRLTRGMLEIVSIPGPVPAPPEERDGKVEEEPSRPDSRDALRSTMRDALGKLAPLLDTEPEAVKVLQRACFTPFWEEMASLEEPILAAGEFLRVSTLLRLLEKQHSLGVLKPRVRILVILAGLNGPADEQAVQAAMMRALSGEGRASATLGGLKGWLEKSLQSPARPSRLVRLVLRVAGIDLQRLKKDWDRTHPRGAATIAQSKSLQKEWDDLYITRYAPDIESALTAYLHLFAVFIGSISIAWHPSLAAFLLLNPATLYALLHIIFVSSHRQVYRFKGGGEGWVLEPIGVRTFLHLLGGAFKIHLPLLALGFVPLIAIPAVLLWGLPAAVALILYFPRLFRSIKRAAIQRHRAYNAQAKTAGGAALAAQWSAPLGKIGPYEVYKELWQSQTATVYLGVSPDSGEDPEPIAVKVPFDDPDSIGTVKMETAVLTAIARLDEIDREHLADLDSAGEEEGLPYLGTKYIPGQSLRAHLEEPDFRRSLGARGALKLIIQVMRGAKALHSLGYVHNNISPDNVIVSNDLERASLIDFGIASRIEDAGVAFTRFKAGSPDDRSPEQIRGEWSGPVSDVYQIGALLWEMLTGEPPFPAAEDDAARLRLRSEPLKGHPDIPPEVMDILRRALAFREEDRFRTPEAMIEALLPLLANGAPAGALHVEAGHPSAVQEPVLLIGGGSIPKPMRKRMIDRARRKPGGLVLVPAASAIAFASALKYADEDIGRTDVPIQAWFVVRDEEKLTEYRAKYEDWREEYEKRGIRVLIKTSDDPGWDEEVDQAGTLFFTGGDQKYIARKILGEKFHQALKRAQRNGLFLAGTSAGTAVMGELMPTGRRDFEGGWEITQGLGLLPPGIITEQHIGGKKRAYEDRGPRMEYFSARFPDKTLLAIAESGAVLVYPDGRIEGAHDDVKTPAAIILHGAERRALISGASDRITPKDSHPERPRVAVLFNHRLQSYPDKDMGAVEIAAHMLVNFLRGQGVEIVILNAWDGILPDLDYFDGMISTGSIFNMGDVESQPWVRRQMGRIRLAAELGVVFLGICFGHQLLIRAYGGTVAKAEYPDGLPLDGDGNYVGDNVVEILDPEHRIVQGLPSEIRVAELHGQQALPGSLAGTVLRVIARSVITAVEIVVHMTAKAFGFQFHPEHAVLMRARGYPNDHGETLLLNFLDIVTDRWKARLGKAPEETGTLRAGAVAAFQPRNVSQNLLEIVQREEQQIRAEARALAKVVRAVKDALRPYMEDDWIIPIREMSDLILLQTLPRVDSSLEEFHRGTSGAVARLEALKDIGAFLEEAREGFKSRVIRRSEKTSALSKGAVVRDRTGDYFILRPVHSGGMGYIHHAIDLETGRDVAVKIPRFHTGVVNSDWKADEALEGEIEVLTMLSGLENPRFLQLIGSGVDRRTETRYLVMEYLSSGEGWSNLLEEMLGRGAPDSGEADSGASDTGGQEPVAIRPQMSVEDVLQIALEILEGLREAHGLGLVHKDLKPSNVMVRRSEQGFQVKIIDFLPNPEPGDGVIWGTRGYLCPEAAKGLDLEPSWDVYALGALMSELLTGFFPEPFPRLQERLREDTTIPPDLKAVIERAVSPRDVRFQSAEDMAAALRPLSDSRLAAGPPALFRGSLSLPLWADVFGAVVWLARFLTGWLRERNRPPVDPDASRPANPTAIRETPAGPVYAWEDYYCSLRGYDAHEALQRREYLRARTDSPLLYYTGIGHPENKWGIGLARRVPIGFDVAGALLETGFHTLIGADRAVFDLPGFEQGMRTNLSFIYDPRTGRSALETLRCHELGAGRFEATFYYNGIPRRVVVYSGKNLLKEDFLPEEISGGYHALMFWGVGFLATPNTAPRLLDLLEPEAGLVLKESSSDDLRNPVVTTIPGADGWPNLFYYLKRDGRFSMEVVAKTPHGPIFNPVKHEGEQTPEEWGFIAGVFHGLAARCRELMWDCWPDWSAARAKGKAFAEKWWVASTLIPILELWGIPGLAPFLGDWTILPWALVFAALHLLRAPPAPAGTPKNRKWIIFLVRFAVSAAISYAAVHPSPFLFSHVWPFLSDSILSVHVSQFLNPYIPSHGAAYGIGAVLHGLYNALVKKDYRLSLIEGTPPLGSVLSALGGGAQTEEAGSSEADEFMERYSGPQSFGRRWVRQNLGRLREIEVAAGPSADAVLSQGIPALGRAAGEDGPQWVQDHLDGILTIVRAAPRLAPLILEDGPALFPQKIIGKSNAFFTQWEDLVAAISLAGDRVYVLFDRTFELPARWSGYDPLPRSPQEPRTRKPMGGPMRAGPYELTRFLGEGGTSLVYQGTAEGLTGESSDVAVKIADPYYIEREVRALRALEATGDPAVLGLVPQLLSHRIALSTEEGNVSYLAMPVIPGTSLDKLFDDPKSDFWGDEHFSDRVEIGLRLFQWMEALHRHGFIHNDLKPGNIFIEKTKEGRYVLGRVIDFALLSNIAEAERSDRFSTGTPSYASPQQLFGEWPGFQSDVYSGGVILHDLITGRHLYPGSYGLPPLLRLMRRFHPNEMPLSISGELRGVVERATALRLEDRYRSAHEVVQALEAGRKRPSPASVLLTPWPWGVLLAYLLEPWTLAVLLPAAVLITLERLHPQTFGLSFLYQRAAGAWRNFYVSQGWNMNAQWEGDSLTDFPVPSNRRELARLLPPLPFPVDVRISRFNDKKYDNVGRAKGFKISVFIRGEETSFILLEMATPLEGPESGKTMMLFRGKLKQDEILRAKWDELKLPGRPWTRGMWCQRTLIPLARQNGFVTFAIPNPTTEGRRRLVEQAGYHLNFRGWLVLNLAPPAGTSAKAGAGPSERKAAGPRPDTWGLWGRLGIEPGRAVEKVGPRRETYITLAVFTAVFFLLLAFHPEGTLLGRLVIAAVAGQSVHALGHVVTGHYRWNEHLQDYEPVFLWAARAPPLGLAWEFLRTFSRFFLSSILFHALFYASFAASAALFSFSPELAARHGADVFRNLLVLSVGSAAWSVRAAVGLHARANLLKALGPPQDNPVRDLMSLNPVRVARAYRELSGSRDLVLAARLKRAYRISGWPRRILIRRLFVRIANPDLFATGRYVGVTQAKRARKIARALEPYLAALGTSFPGQALRIRKEGSANGEVGARLYQHLKRRLRHRVRFTASDRVTEYVFLRDAAGRVAVFSNEPGVRDSLEQIRINGRLYVRDPETGKLEIPADEGAVVEGFRAAYRRCLSHESPPQGFSMSRMGTALGEAEELARRDERFKIEAHAAPDPLPDSERAHVTVVSNTLSKAYPGKTSEDVIRAAGRNAVEGGLVLVVNDVYSHDGEAFPHVVLRRAGDRLEPISVHDGDGGGAPYAENVAPDGSLSLQAAADGAPPRREEPLKQAPAAVRADVRAMLRVYILGGPARSQVRIPFTRFDVDADALLSKRDRARESRARLQAIVTLSPDQELEARLTRFLESFDYRDLKGGLSKQDLQRRLAGSVARRLAERDSGEAFGDRLERTQTALAALHGLGETLLDSAPEMEALYGLMGIPPGRTPRERQAADYEFVVLQLLAIAGGKKSPQEVDPVRASGGAYNRAMRLSEASERVEINVRQGIPMAFELTEDFLNVKIENRDLNDTEQATLDKLRVVARLSEELKGVPVTLVVPEETWHFLRRVPLLGNGLRRRGERQALQRLVSRDASLAGLEGRLRLVYKEDAAVRSFFSGRRAELYSVEKLMKVAQGRKSARDLDEMELFLVDRSEWRLESSVQNLVKILILLLDDMAYDATLPRHEDLERLNFVASMA